MFFKFISTFATVFWSDNENGWKSEKLLLKSKEIYKYVHMLFYHINIVYLRISQRICWLICFDFDVNSDATQQFVMLMCYSVVI